MVSIGAPLLVGARLRLSVVVAGRTLSVAPSPQTRAAFAPADALSRPDAPATPAPVAVRRLKSVPTLPPDAQIEAIFLIPDPQDTTAPRTPPPELAGLKIVGDIMTPGIEQDDVIPTYPGVRVRWEG